MQEKLLVAIGIVVLALIFLTVRLYIIQHDNNEEYSKIVLSQRQNEYVSKTINARRGDIYDRNGTRLASSNKVYNLILDPRRMRQSEGADSETQTSKKSVIEPTVEALCSYFGFEKTDLVETINDRADSSYVRYKRELSYEEKQGFETLVKEQNKKYSGSADGIKKEISGYWFEEEYKRSYPNGALACNVIGFTKSDGTGGIGGVEQYYNSELVGVNGREYGYLNDETDLERVVRSARNGNSLVLTIDSTIQSIVERRLDEWKHGEIGSDSAACIVMDPDSGEILAMAGTGRFDLNDPRTTEGFTDEEIYDFGLDEALRVYRQQNPDAKDITKEEMPEHFSREDIMSYGAQTAWNYNWRNTCISDTYEPGSVQKVFTVAGALEENVITMDNQFLCEGYKQLSDGVNTWKINCVNRNGHGPLDVTGGIAQSCNCVMMDIAFMEKSETFMKYEKLFGFGDYTGIDLPAEADTSKLGFENDEIGRTALATNSFGQNYNCTMIQMISAFSSIVNGGYYYEPHVLKEIRTPEGILVSEKKPLLVRQTVSGETCNKVKKAMLETVEGGTGSAAAVEGYTVAGKTGTAQKLPRSAKTYVVSFCGFAPYDEPELVCYVIVDEPHLAGEEAAHSSFASEIFSKIMAEALPVVGVYPDGVKASEYKNQDALLSENEGDSQLEMGSREETQEESSAAGEENGEETAQEEPHVPETDEFYEGEDTGEELPDMLSSQAE